MKKIIEYTVKAILIVLVLLGYQSLHRYLDVQLDKSYQIIWAYLGYAIRILSLILCGMILAYNEFKSGKAGVIKFILLVMAIALIAYPFNPFNTGFLAANHIMIEELITIMALTCGILLTGIKF